jgi:succinate dehydrogenase/fumarate reductase flavoprotein subunit
MNLDQIADRVVETDVLVIGGGIAGCPAAAKAAEHGLNVTLIEKSKLDRSGSAAMGIDGYMGPVSRGLSVKDYKELAEKLGPGGFFGGIQYADPTMLYRIWANWEWTVEELEKLGVPMKWDDGELLVLDVTSHGGMPGLRIHWMRVKPLMAAAVRERGVNVLERTMVIDLLTKDSAVVGATAVNSRTGEFVVIKAKATIMATAACSRVVSPETPQPWKYKFRYHWNPASVSGDGWAMAYRAGAELANMEQGGRGYRFRDDLVMSYGNVRGHGVEAKHLTWDGEEFVRRNLTELEQQGKDPFYYSLEHLPEDYYKRVQSAFVDERLVSFKIAEDRGINPKNSWIEFMDGRVNQLHVPPGINADGNFKSSLNGFYAIGDCVAGVHSVAEAAACGFLVGEGMPSVVSSINEPVVNEDQVKNQKKTAFASTAVKDGTEPMELECAIRYICDHYVGLHKNEGKLREGLRRLGSLRREFLPKLMAKNPHFLMRCLEVRNLMDVAELYIRSSMDREESRGEHSRLDFHETDEKLNDLILYQRLENEKPVIEMRKLVPIQFPDDHTEVY